MMGRVSKMAQQRYLPFKPDELTSIPKPYKRSERTSSTNLSPILYAGAMACKHTHTDTHGTMHVMVNEI